MNVSSASSDTSGFLLPTNLGWEQVYSQFTPENTYEWDLGGKRIPLSILTLLVISSPKTWFSQGFLITVTLGLDKVFTPYLSQKSPT